jgi:hypothetical protein
MLSDTCSIENLDDEDACPRCVPTDTCANECGECELCLGQTLDDLPESCGNPGDPNDVPDGSVTTPTPGVDGGAPGETGEPTTPGVPGDPDEPVNVCDNGAACSTSTDCEAGDYCRLGCCVPFQSNIR